MNLKNIDIKKLFKKHSFHKKEYQNLSLKAAHDWKLILGFFLIAIVATAVLNFYLFMRISEGEAFGSYGSSEVEKETINIKELEKIISFFEEKERKGGDYIDSQKWNVDPSL